MVVVMMMAAADRPREIRNAGQLAGLRSIGEIRGQLIQLGRQRVVSPAAAQSELNL
jgi:hypothetical protein